MITTPRIQKHRRDFEAVIAAITVKPATKPFDAAYFRPWSELKNQSLGLWTCKMKPKAVMPGFMEAIASSIGNDFLNARIEDFKPGRRAGIGFYNSISHPSFCMSDLIGGCDPPETYPTLKTGNMDFTAKGIFNAIQALPNRRETWMSTYNEICFLRDTVAYFNELLDDELKQLIDDYLDENT
jgi:hypothetical protein